VIIDVMLADLEISSSTNLGLRLVEPGAPLYRTLYRTVAILLYYTIILYYRGYSTVQAGTGHILWLHAVHISHFTVRYITYIA